MAAMDSESLEDARACCLRPCMGLGKKTTCRPQTLSLILWKKRKLLLDLTWISGPPYLTHTVHLPKVHCHASSNAGLLSHKHVDSSFHMGKGASAVVWQHEGHVSHGCPLTRALQRHCARFYQRSTSSVKFFLLLGVLPCLCVCVCARVCMHMCI